jgi:hypothetical protein
LAPFFNNKALDSSFALSSGVRPEEFFIFKFAPAIISPLTTWVRLEAAQSMFTSAPSSNKTRSRDLF